MRIACACRVFKTQKDFPGGMINVMATRCAELARRGHDVHVLTTALPEGRAGAAEMEVDGYTVHHLAEPSGKYSDAYLTGCHAMCVSLQPDIIHVDGGGSDWWADRPGNPKCIAMTPHGTVFEQWFTHWHLYHLGWADTCHTFDVKRGALWNKRYACLDAVFACCRYQEWQFRELHGLSNVRLLYNPLPAQFFAPRVPPPADGYFAIFKANRQRGTPTARAAAKKAGVELRVVQAVHYEDIPAVYDGCKAFVAPMVCATGYDITVAEAMARGRPSITCPVGAYFFEGIDKPWIQHVPMDDPDALAERMLAPLPEVPEGAGDAFRVERHVAGWLEGCGC